MKNMTKLGKVSAIFSILMVALVGIAMASSTSTSTIGDPMANTYSDLHAWAQGSVGKTVTLACILVGVVIGVARQSLMAFAVGIFMGLGIYNSPGIIDTIFSATF